MTDQQSKAEIFAKLPADIQTFLKRKATPAIAIDVTRAKQPLGLTSSKFGGLPYIAPNADCPRDEKGYPYQLLAQFNFADIAEQAGQHPDLPATGLLQIFIPCYDHDGSGILEDRQQTRFFPDIPDASQVNQTVLAELQAWNDDLATLDFAHWDDQEREKQREAAKAAFIKKYNRYHDSPILSFYVECALHFDMEIVYPCSQDEVDFYRQLRLDDKTRELYDKFTEREWYKQYLLGYPNGFMQYDPRSYDFVGEIPESIPESFRPYQIDDYGSVVRSDWRTFLEFSDVYETSRHPLIDWLGFHFMIKKERLSKYDFSDLIGYWDCD